MRTINHNVRYGNRHQRFRRRIARIVDGGMAICHLCGEAITPGTPWDLDHVPGQMAYRGPAHAHCNRSDGARRGHAKRGIRRSRVW